jgi:hypothetical protein
MPRSRVRVPLSPPNQWLGSHVPWQEFKVPSLWKEQTYTDVRKKLGQSVTAESVIVVTIAAALFAKFGMPFGVIANYVVLVLLSLVKPRKNAFCATAKWDIPVLPRKKTSISE